ncbi:hypothetical protein B9Z55_025601 [Caenorhabditis nigoni]|uniref:Uncharacterized protein n=1 Tax=Caenorhabditis nigoni TaxID=1611254 RepID=A0A2G5SZG5_9PELO|nr:hypothetical protein B9Z55_025601 [Caenorhabditis nigoni]
MTGTTNVCILPMVNALKTFDPDNHFPAVRLTSEAHRERLDPALRTSIDYLGALPEDLQAPDCGRHSS